MAVCESAVDAQPGPIGGRRELDGREDGDYRRSEPCRLQSHDGDATRGLIDLTLMSGPVDASGAAPISIVEAVVLAVQTDHW